MYRLLAAALAAVVLTLTAPTAQASVTVGDTVQRADHINCSNVWLKAHSNYYQLGGPYFYDEVRLEWDMRVFSCLNTRTFHTWIEFRYYSGAAVMKDRETPIKCERWDRPGNRIQNLQWEVRVRHGDSGIEYVTQPKKVFVPCDEGNYTIAGADVEIPSIKYFYTGYKQFPHISVYGQMSLNRQPDVTAKWSAFDDGQ